MWLPAPIYERLPLTYVVIGLLFFAGTLYIGLDAEMSEIYMGLGFISMLGGLVVFLRRRTERARQTEEQDVSPDGDPF